MFEEKSILRQLFRRIEPGEELPPTPPALLEWGTQTAYAVTFGTLVGAYRGLLVARDPGVPNPPGVFTRKQRASYFVALRSLAMGLKLGLFAATFSVINIYLRGDRQRDDAVNPAASGGLVSGLFTLLRFGPCSYVLPVSIFGAAAGGSLGYAQQRLKEVVETQSSGSQTEIKSPQESMSPERAAQMVIEDLEESIRLCDAYKNQDITETVIDRQDSVT